MRVIFECILGLAEALNDEISYFSIKFSAAWGVFECILGSAEVLKDEI